RTTDNGPPSAPAWFRYGVIAAAAILMCSCRSAEPRYRIAQDQPRAGSQAQAPSFMPLANIPQYAAAVAHGVQGTQHDVAESGSGEAEQLAFADDSQEATASLRQPTAV